MENTALANGGDWKNLATGFSSPVSGTVGTTGDEVAFLPSFAEQVAFCSLGYSVAGSTYPASPAGAQVNLNALNILHSKCEIGRSTTTEAPTAVCTTLFSTSFAPNPLGAGIVGPLIPTSVTAPYYARPMMWVNNQAGASLFENR
jgi:hypothetical protein